MRQLSEQEARDLVGRLMHSSKDRVVADKLCESALLEFEARCLQGDQRSADDVRAKLHASTDMMLDAIASSTAISLSVMAERKVGDSGRIWKPMDSLRSAAGTVALRMRDGTIVQGRRGTLGFYSAISGEPLSDDHLSGWDEIRPGD